MARVSVYYSKPELGGVFSAGVVLFFRWKRNTSKSGHFFQDKKPMSRKYNILNRNNIKNAR